VAGFYSARRSIMPPLPWTTFAPPLSADVKRIGALDVENPSVQLVALRYGVQFIDISDVEASGLLNHDRYTALAALLPQLEESIGGQGSEFGRAGAFVFDTIGVTLSSPFHLASKIVNPEH